jgi:hypothetical protein
LPARAWNLRCDGALPLVVVRAVSRLDEDVVGVADDMVVAAIGAAGWLFRLITC